MWCKVADVVEQVDVVHSVGYFRDALDIALLHENVSAMKALCLEFFNNKTAKRAAMTSSMLTQQNTGTYVIVKTLPAQLAVAML